MKKYFWKVVAITFIIGVLIFFAAKAYAAQSL